MKEIAYYDPLLFKCPIGAIAKNTEVTFAVRVASIAQPKQVFLLIKEDSKSDYEYHSPAECKHVFDKMKPNDAAEDLDIYYFKIKFDNAGHYWYCFKLEYENSSQFLNKTYNNYSYLSSVMGENYFQLVCEKEYTQSDAILAGGIIYQIMVDRFAKVGEPVVREPFCYRQDWGGALCKNTHDPIKINQEVFGGNFEGVISKLDYLAELGITTIYFNPICIANSNHKYDTADYMQLDSMYGTEQQFKNLIKSAKAKGISIVMDGVYNHTGSDSIYFNKNKRFGEGGAYNDRSSPYYEWYEWQHYPNRYGSWWGIDTLPSIKGDCESFQSFIAGENGVIEKYMKMGIAGFRLDVVDEITDEFLAKITERVHKNKPNGVVMGEVWEDAATKISYSRRRKYFSGNLLTSVMNYPVKESIINYLRCKEPIDFVSTIRMLTNNYPKFVQHNLMNFLGTHDTGRIMSELTSIAGGDYILAKKFLRIAVGLSFTTIGVPSIFYGDEMGMENNDGSSRGCFVQSETSGEILAIYKQFAALRKLDVFKFGDMNILYGASGKLVYERISSNQRVIVLSNLRESTLTIELVGEYVSLLTNKKFSNTSFELKNLDFEILQEIQKK